jgi:hypothetical protein
MIFMSYVAGGKAPLRLARISDAGWHGSSGEARICLRLDVASYLTYSPAPR